jgi:hypothetical protein
MSFFFSSFCGIPVSIKLSCSIISLYPSLVDFLPAAPFSFFKFSTLRCKQNLKGVGGFRFSDFVYRFLGGEEHKQTNKQKKTKKKKKPKAKAKAKAKAKRGRNSRK